ncbi:aminomethyltransferase [Loktanella sp. DSM 29012]|uniref:glycine cleavage system aminomethyltransferase GcvT n=1 Tax=Loktanella sp. DSM 29012 TaxID=1881056 RepID=UPI0008AC737D|nr:glycine cleavage system aminomethyltransferase GcvT [Loktanella sp. DSM 29012]SEQ47599.1 aminomethyltransferase [Loktanella sp. DSM 29012]
MDENRKTPLFDLHVALGGKIVGFAGYDLPVQYTGVLPEHLHTRTKAGLFDVSHMGQCVVAGPSYAAVAQALESLIPVDIAGLADGRQRYGFLTNDAGGIRDDLMLARRGDSVFMVVNAACKAADIAHIRAHLPDGVKLTEVTDRALLALQGPLAENALATLNPAARSMRFMDVIDMALAGVTCWVSRSGYTGEDGYEISVPAAQAEPLAVALLDLPDVAPIGLGARDSLRLEAGLCLYGHDIDDTTTPVAAGLTWAIQKVRRPGGARAGGYPGADIIGAELADAPPTARVGLLPDGRAPMREGVEIFADADAQTPIGRITSGGFGPTVQRPVAMALIDRGFAAPGTALCAELRGKRLPVTVAAMPFTPANFKR